MADTIVTNSPGTSDSGAAGMVIALIALVVVVVGGIVMYQRGFFNDTSKPGDTNINVTIPNPTTDSGAKTN